jgi:hypothetical protein
MAYNPIAGNPNDLPVATSDWEIRNRIFLGLTYTDEFFADAPTSVSIFYNGQSGRPFSFIYNGDVNGDGFNSNDLFYIPKNNTDIELGTISSIGIYTPNQQMYSDFNSFIGNNEYLNSHKGQIAERNAANNPWYDQLDLRIVQDIPVFGIHRAQVSLDILNVLNLINSDWGWYEHTSLPTYQIVKLEGKDAASGKNVYSFKKPDNNTPWSADDILSRWAMQIGLRYYF